MINVQKVRSWFPRGRNHRAKAFAEAAFPACTAHRAEALTTFPVLERLAGHRLDHVELDAPLSEVLPDRHALERLTLEQVAQLVMALEEEFGLTTPAPHTEAREEIWATTAHHALLGPKAQANTWDASTIWSRSLRGIINERVSRGIGCSCAERDVSNRGDS